MTSPNEEPRTALSNDPTCCCAWWPEDEHGWLVNFSQHPVEIAGERWNTVEHFYQAQRFPTSPDIVARIRATPDPAEAKKIAYEAQHLPYVRKDWEELREGVMLTGLRAKLAQHPDVEQALRATGERRIVEDSPEDSFWGCGKDGKGRNRLGEMWELLRSELPRGAPSTQ